MIVLSGALVLVALVLLVFGALDRNLPYVYASIGVSLLSLLLLLVGIVQRRGELAGEEHDEATTPVTDTTDERVPALAGAQDADRSGGGGPGSAARRRAAAGVAPGRAGRGAGRGRAPEAEPFEDEAFEDEDLDEDEPSELEDGRRRGRGRRAGRLRRHRARRVGPPALPPRGLPGAARQGAAAARPRRRADARLHARAASASPTPTRPAAEPQPDDAPQTADDASFTETLFGGPLFADSPPAEAREQAAEPDRVETSALPDRPVQPVLTEVDRPAEPVAEAPSDAGARRGAGRAAR